MAASAREVQNLITTVVGLQGNPISNAVPVVGDALVWDGSQWLPRPPAGGGGVQSVAAGTGLTGGTITDTGTIALATPVSIANGGTAGNTALAARTNLDVNTFDVVLYIPGQPPSTGTRNGFSWPIPGQAMTWPSPQPAYASCRVAPTNLASFNLMQVTRAGAVSVLFSFNIAAGSLTGNGAGFIGTVNFAATDMICVGFLPPVVDPTLQDVTIFLRLVRSA